MSAPLGSCRLKTGCLVLRRVARFANACKCFQSTIGLILNVMAPKVWRSARIVVETSSLCAIGASDKRSEISHKSRHRIRLFVPSGCLVASASSYAQPSPAGTTSDEVKGPYMHRKTLLQPFIQYAASGIRFLDSSSCAYVCFMLRTVLLRLPRLL